MRKLKPKYKTLFISLSIVLYMFIALGFSGKKASEKRCTRIDVEILDSNRNMFISAKDIDKILERNEFNIMGYPIKEINSLVIEKAVEKHPSIELANVYTNVKGNINVRVLQRNPIVRILQPNGNSYYIDDKGLLMPLSYNYTSRVPIVTGNIERNYQDYKKQDLQKIGADTLLQDIFLLSKEIKKNKYWLAMCNQIVVSEKQELMIIPKIGAKQILLGKSENYADNLKTLTAFYTEVLPVVGWEKYKTINLQYNKQIVCK